MNEGATRLEAQDQKQHADVGYWTGFVQRFFSPNGVYRHSILDHKELKDYQITVPALTRYFYTHFESGIKNMQLITEKASEKELPNHYYFLESPKASFIYWFDNGSHVSYALELFPTLSNLPSLLPLVHYEHNSIRIRRLKCSNS